MQPHDAIGLPGERLVVGHQHQGGSAAAVQREQQRVALARAVALDPGLLLADEPTGNLDSATGVQIIELLLALNQRRGSTLVLVTHDEALAGRADRVVRLHDGRILNGAS